MPLPSDILKKIHRIEINSTQLAKDILAGAYRSAFKGQGMEFEEVREYIPGDEVRNIDWNVTARMQNPYIKVYREERDLTVFLLVDISASNRFGSHSSLKSEFIAEIGAVLAFSAIRNNDRIGLILFSDQIELYIPPKKGTRHVLRIIREILLFQPKHKGSDLKKALSFFGSVQAKTSICFLLSDFLFGVDYEQQAKVISQHHDLISICVTDSLEHKMPSTELVHFSDLESGESMYVNTSSKHFQESFSKNISEKLLHHRNIMRASGIPFINIETDQSYVAALRKFFTLRKRKSI